MPLTERNREYPVDVKHPVELLAPAGSMDAFHAALAAGADAIYLGLGSFNARRNADNFTYEQLAEACTRAHIQHVRVYLTLNTLINDDESPAALEAAAAAWEAGIDAFIVQDLGVLSLLRRFMSQAPVHISTQLNVIDPGAVRTAVRLGAERVTLGREVSLEELPELCSQGAQIEVFAHGALCVCYSGQCLMSSLIGTRSANRGLCAQPCRLPYELVSFDGGKEGKKLSAAGDFLLSPKDLCTIDLLPQLIACGVTSLKIEGRMKSPDYVATVVSVYRACLDRALADPDNYRVTEREHQMLSEAFSRGFTTGYLEHKRGEELMSYQRPNNRGIAVGRVTWAGQGQAEITCSKAIRIGDVLEFWTRKGRVTTKVEELRVDGALVNRVASGETCVLAVEGIRQGDRVFRVRSQELLDDVEALKAEVKAGVTPLEFSVHVHRGAPLLLEVRNAEGLTVSVEGPVCEAARTKAITTPEIEEHIGRLGGTPYIMADCQVDLDEGIGMGYSTLHKLRNAGLAKLESALLTDYRSRKPVVVSQADLDAFGVPAPASDLRENCKAGVITGAEALASKLIARGLEVYAPAFELEAWGDPSRATCILPTVIHEAEYPRMIGIARTAKAAVCDSVWALARLEAEGVPVEAGSRCNVLNHFSLAALEELGAASVWVSPESSLAQIRELGSSTRVPLTMVVRGNCELMITEQCQLGSMGTCVGACATCARRNKSVALKDRKGYLFPVRTDEYGRGHIYNSVSLDAVPFVVDLAASVSRFVVDGTLMDEAQVLEEADRLLQALTRCSNPDAEPLPKVSGATTGHLFRGVG